MSDTTVQDCKCCGFETDCINGLCEPCSDYHHNLLAAIKIATNFIDGYGKARLKEGLGRDAMDIVLKHIQNKAT